MGSRASLCVAVRRAARAALPAVAVIGSALVLCAQSSPQAVSLATVVTYPDFYADRTLVVHGRLRATNGPLSFEDDAGHRVLAIWRDRAQPDGPVEATGQLLDLGRMKQDDGRLSGFDLSPILRASGQQWPRPGDVYVFAVTSSQAVEDSPVSTIRSVVLDGSRSIGRLVTLSGQFRGRNLFGDLPQAPGNARTNFVLRAANAAIWIVGMAPKGKNFELDPDHRVDTNRWLRVTGIVRETKGLMWIEAKSIELAQRDATQTDAPPTANAPPAQPRPPEVLFSVPVDGETDVSPSSTVRIELSRDLDPASLEGHVRVVYVGAGGTNAAPPPPSPKFRIELDQRERVMTLRFVQPLQPWQRVQVDLLDGVKGTDGAAMKAWSLTFTVGGQ